MRTIRVRVPATTANLGPGFDCLGAALNLWNEATFEPAATWQVAIRGEGAETLPRDAKNLMVRAALRVFASQPQQATGAARITCINRIPMGAGLGSSAAATLLGLLGGNALLGNPLTPNEVLRLAIEIEGHPDNVAPALLGGLTISGLGINGEMLTRRFKLPRWYVAVAVPEIRLPTKQARAALPPMVTHGAAVRNLGRSLLVVEALRTGDATLLSQAMCDELHEPYRLPLIPEASAVLQAARNAGAVAATISGAGSGLIAFVSQKSDAAAVGEAMRAAFAEAGVAARVFLLHSSQIGGSTKEYI